MLHQNHFIASASQTKLTVSEEKKINRLEYPPNLKMSSISYGTQVKTLFNKKRQIEAPNRPKNLL